MCSGLGILSDFAGIYLSSKNNTCFRSLPNLCHLPSHIHNNWIHNCSRYNYGCEAVYMDEQVSGVVIEHNLIHDIEDEGIYFHCGSDNIANNNIIAFAGQALSSYTPSSRSQDISARLLPGMCNSGGNPTYPDMGAAIGFNFTRNIVLLDGPAEPPTRMPSVFRDTRQTHWERNTYYSLNSTVVTALNRAPVWPNGSTLSEWSASIWTGKDQAGSIVADPLFSEPKSRIFNLSSASPAFRLGFQPFAVDPGSFGCANNCFSEC